MEKQKNKRIFDKNNRVVVLTGAGISAESGIPTFRGKDGLWKKYDVTQLATPEAFKKNPQLVWEWYNYRREIISQALPNQGHKIIAELEKYYNDFLLITQNIDGLHIKAGNKKVIELHGNIWRNKCSKCGKSYGDIKSKNVPKCEICGGYIRPDVVWFGESLDKKLLEKAFSKSSKADIFLVVGTSAVVYPAAYFPQVAKNNGAFLIEINIEETPISGIADIIIRKSASAGLNELFGKLLEGGL